MRFYAIGNGYLSSIQHGIQAFHVLGEMVCNRGAEHPIVDEWLHNHKTLVCLNGGHDSKMQELYLFLGDERNPYPIAKFHEENMGNMLTSLGVIVPETVYGIDLADASTWGNLTSYEVELATRLKKLPLAR